MKNIITFLLMLLSLSSYSQTINIKDFNGKRVSGSYYKDADFILDPYVGTWIYSNGADTLKIKLRKVIMALSANNSHEDLIVGEYLYIRNGVEKINTLNSFNFDYTAQRKHNITGNAILESHHRPPCTSCSPNEKRLRLILYEPLSTFAASLTIRLISIGGQPALQVFKWGIAPIGRTPAEISLYQSAIIEIGTDFTMIKQ